MISTVEMGEITAARREGANVHIATLALAKEMETIGYRIERVNQPRGINTAGKGAQLKIVGWLEAGGKIGKMAICPGANESLVSVVKMTAVGLR